MAVHTMEQLRMFQKLPLEAKVNMTVLRIREWVREYGEDGVYVSFSGGKDSTVLLDIVRKEYPDVKAVFVDTGLEYPEIRTFVKTFSNVDWVKPKMNFKQVITKYGYPMISKEVSNAVQDARINIPLGIETLRVKQILGKTEGKFDKGRWKFLINSPFKISDNCCRIMKKSPAHQYNKKYRKHPLIATMATESKLRQTIWLKFGCNGFQQKNPQSTPMSFWTEQDVLQYIKNNNIKIASVYGDVVYSDEFGNFYDTVLLEGKLTTTGCKRTGCMFCGYGCHLEKQGQGRFELMKQTHPRQYEYIMKPTSEGGLGYKEIIDWINYNGNLNIRY